MSDLKTAVHELRAQGGFELPPPGRGETAARHKTLSEFARRSLSLARIAEAHTDAAAILTEAGMKPDPKSIYGVWASDGPNSRVAATALDVGGWKIEGLKQYCSGSTIVDAALVTAYADDHLLLFEIPLNAPGVSVRQSTWVNAGLADTATGPVAFTAVTVGESALIGAPGWYLTRPGFWHGAIGPAACWAGGAMFLIDAAAKSNKQDAHSRAHLGAIQSIGWGLEAILAQAGQAIDADPNDAYAEARTRALKVRHLIERWCTEVLDRFGRATGPQLLAFDEQVARQYAALTVYIRQCHAERDLETIPLAP
jgi:alkylation response protein AidB-like acyl-CoA dehydrogenase